MKKKLLLFAGIAVLALVLVLAGFPLFSRLYYGRSQAATLFAWQLKKEAYTTEEALQAYLEEKRGENSAPYELPYDDWLGDAPERREYGGLTCYVLNGEAAERVILYFPGGSYIDQPRAVHWRFLNDLAEQTGVPITGSGGVSSLEDLRELKKAGCAGAILGKALYEKAFTLPEAMAAVRDE